MPVYVSHPQFCFLVRKPFLVLKLYFFILLVLKLILFFCLKYFFVFLVLKLLTVNFVFWSENCLKIVANRKAAD